MSNEQDRPHEARPQQEERCWMCGGHRWIDKRETDENPWWSAATGGESGQRWPVYSLHAAPGAFAGELIACPFCKPVHVPPLPVEPASTVETARLRETAEVIAGHSGQRGSVGDHESVTIQFREEQWRAFQDAVFASRKPVDPTPVEPRQEDYFDPPLGTPERTALHDSLWKGAVALTGSVEEAGRLFGTWLDEITRQRNEALAPVPESPAPQETAADRVLANPASTRKALEVARRVKEKQSSAPVEDEASGWERVGESTNGPSGEAIAVWVNTKDGKIAPVRLAVEQAIAHQFALEQYDILKTRAERAEAEVERMKAALVAVGERAGQTKLIYENAAITDIALIVHRALDASTPVQEVE